MVGPAAWIDCGLGFRILRHLGADAFSRAILDMAFCGLSIHTRHFNARRRCDGMALVTHTYCCSFVTSKFMTLERNFIQRLNVHEISSVRYADTELASV